MYKDFFNLKSLPFQIDTDPTFLWLGEKHREAISMLKYGIQTEGHTGLLLLTGDVGTGKTTLINALFKSLDRSTIRVAVTNPSLDGLDFLNYIASAFGSKRTFSSKSSFLTAFERFLKNASAKNRKVLLVIDEAQLVSNRLLEEVRLFSNIESNGRSIMKTFLVGQNELRATLCQPENRALKQRITLNYKIDALVFKETEEYIKYRLQVAGTAAPIFDPQAVQLIHKYAEGLPRKINILCDHAMLTGYVKNTKTINSQIIRECVNEIAIHPVSPSRVAGMSDLSVPEPHETQASAQSRNVLDREENGELPGSLPRKETAAVPSDLTMERPEIRRSSKTIMMVLVSCLILAGAAAYLFIL